MAFREKPQGLLMKGKAVEISLIKHEKRKAASDIDEMITNLAWKNLTLSILKQEMMFDFHFHSLQIVNYPSLQRPV
jgi:hypothetical protein